MRSLLICAAVTTASCITISSFAQNVFPPSGRAGIHTTTPVAALEVAGGARFGRPTQYLNIDSATGNLSFGGNASLRVGGNRYAFQYSADPDYGLYFNSTSSRYEFRNGAAIPVFYVNANNGDGVFSGIVGVGGSTDNSYILNVNASSLYDGIRITDPVDNTILSSTKSGANNGMFLSKTSTTSGVATLYSTNSGTGAGAYGQSYYGSGIYGNSTEGYGVQGNSYNDYGVYAYSANYRALYAEGEDGFYTAYFNGDVYAVGNYSGSDAKLKKNIQDVNNAMDIINQLKPKHYEFRSDGNFAKMKLPKGNHYGLIAQDVEKILPQLVKESTFETRDARPRKPTAEASEEEAKAALNDKNETIDFKAVNYTELIPILVKALQEQDAKIESLKKELREMKQSEPAMTANETSAAISINTTNAIKAIPNPARSSVTVSGLNKTGMLSITDMQGRQLIRHTVSADKAEINISTLKPGTYIILYNDNGQIKSSKLVKE